MNRDNNESLCWFHENLSREAAEELIKKESNEDGTFLVRESTTAAGDFVLTLLYQGDVCHYQIRRHGEDAFFSIDDKVRILHGLDSLVNFYKQESHGLVTTLKGFIKKDLPPNHTRSHGVTNLLHRATKQNEKTVITELLKCGYRNIDAKNQFGQTALHLACIHCDEQILSLFLDANVAVNVMDAEGNMPLHYACRYKPASFIKKLLDKQASIHGRNINNGYVPLHEAASFGNLSAVQELLNAHAPLLPRTKFGEFPIDLAKEKNQTEVVEYLSNYKIAPANTFQEHWYHGTLKREEAIDLLKSFAQKMMQTANVDALNNSEPKDPSGCFLVRFSENNKSSGFVLTLLWNDQVKHYQIGQSSKYYFIDEGPYLPTLEHLIEHFMRFADGLPVNLKHPVKPKPKPPLPFICTMPRPAKKKLPEASQAKAQDESPSTSKDSKAPPFASHSLGHKKKSNNSVFSTLKLTSPRKSKADKNTLKASKNKSKNEDFAAEKQLDPAVEVHAAQTFLKSLSFSTDFKASGLTAAFEPNDHELYNIPQNNAAVDSSAIASDMGLEKKTPEEIEYLTQSDITIEKERLKSLNNCAKTERQMTENSNGYVPTVDIRVFVDQGTAAVPSLDAEGNLTELRSVRPERNDTFVSSVVSTASQMNRFFNQSRNPAFPASDLSSSGHLNYFIPVECIELETIIGKGEFGEVYKGRLKKVTDNGEEPAEWQVAIKTLRDEHCRVSKEEFLREASVMIRLHHHCIVQLLGISKGESLMMVQELVSFGSMLQYILDNRATINPNFELKLWASQIACGMEYLESQHFVHRDLAARNILLASRNQAKISDFGLSRALDAGNECYQASQGGKWPIKWYAPESFKNGIFSHASDVWSFGVTLWEMFTLGEPPYGDIRGVQVINLIENGQRLPQPVLCPGHVYEIMKNCWNFKPKDRPSFRFLTEFFAKDPDYQNICELVKSFHIG